MENFKVIGGRILIKQDEAEQMSAGGIIIPGNAQNKEPIVWGEVVAVGSAFTAEWEGCMDVHKHTPDVEVGQRIMFPPRQGNFIQLEGEDYILIDADRCLVVEEKVLVDGKE